MYITAVTLDDLMRRVLGKLVRSDSRNKASRGGTRELRSVLLRLTNPRARLSHTERKGKVFSGLGELLWYLARSNDLEFISYYLDQYRKESEDGATVYGAYGPRLFDRVRSRQCQGFPGNPGGFHPQSGVSRSLNRSTTIEKEASFV